MKDCVSVVIPTFNRAHLLARTVPTYLQPGVAEILLVDDASTDNTQDVLAQLAREIPVLRHVRLPENRRQMYAKNFGIAHTTGPLIYFGDDDSVMTAGSIPALISALEQQQADIAGAKALYAEEAEDIGNIESFVRKHDIIVEDVQQIVDFARLKFNFTYSTRNVERIPVTHACFLIRREWACRIQFDEEYILNGYREETDFLLRAHLAGARTCYQPLAVQVNLPRREASGGAHSTGRLVWLLACVYNNWRFLRKNYPELMKREGVNWNLYRIQGEFMVRGLRKIWQQRWKDL